jgi:hypothetical protein
VLKQVDYDYQRMQYNTVVSGAMKMINALEDFKARRLAGRQVALIAEGFGICCACCTRPRRTSPTAVAGAGLRRCTWAICWMRPGPGG